MKGVSGRIRWGRAAWGAFIALHLVFAAFMAVLLPPAQTAVAQTAKTETTAPVVSKNCFTKSECDSLGDFLEGNGCTTPEGKCYQRPVPVTLSIPIGDKKVIADVGEYIAVIYKFAIGIASVIAAIMMMIGGFQYLTAGGDAGRVTAGKQRITDALVGLGLALGAFTMLNTVNPDLVKLQLPRVEIVKPEKFQGGVPSGQMGNKCDSDADCAAPNKCILFKPGLVETFAADVSSIGGKIAEVSLGSGSVTGILLGLTFKVPDKIISSIGSKGFCGVEADHNVENGNFCADNKHCISNNCLKIPGAYYIGRCTSGEADQPCLCPGSADFCEGGGCLTGKGLTCAKYFSKGDTSACSTGEQGQYCAKGMTCKGGSACRQIGGVWRCVAAEAGGLQAACITHADCDQTRSLRCIKPYLSTDCAAANAASTEKLKVCLCVEPQNTDGPCYSDANCAYGYRCHEYNRENDVVYTDAYVVNGQLGFCRYH